MAGKGRDVVSAVKDRVDIVDVVKEYADLRLTGGRWMAPCPFHQETKPSFTVKPEDGFYYCFGCKASGDVIDFYKNINGLEFRDAVEQLAERAGIDSSGFGKGREKGPGRDEKRIAYKLHALAAEIYSRSFRSKAGGIAREYATKRGMAPEIIETFGIGYSPDAWHDVEQMILKEGHTKQDGVAAGLLVQNERGKIYDRFRGRLMFPITDMTGRPVAFGARTLTGDDPKYLNSPESAIYTKGDHLYGLHQARRTIAQKRRALLTEGYTDVLSLHQYGFTQACGVLGTALTPNQVKRLSNLCSLAELVFDGDHAGRKAAFKAVEMFVMRGMAVRVVLLPDGEDVDGLLQEKGADAFQALLDNAEEGLNWAFRYVSETHSPMEIMQWAKKLLEGLTKAGLGAYYLPKIASGLGLDERELREGLSGGGSHHSESDLPDALKAPAEESFTTLSFMDKQLLAFAVSHKDSLPLLGEAGIRHAFSSGAALSLWEKLVSAEDEHGIPQGMNDDERRFWIESRLAEQQTEGDPTKALKEVCDFIHSRRRKKYSDSCTDELRKMQNADDPEAVKRLLREKCRLMRRPDEQH